MAIERVAVLGAGTMGYALALVHALGGCHVTLYDHAPEILARAPSLIQTALATLQEAGTESAVSAKAAVERIAYADTLAAAVEAADLVVEAVIEDPEIKRAVFAQVDAHAPAAAILASNTSYLDVFPLIPNARQSRATVAHWYTPPYIVDLVDLAPGPDTDRQVITELRTLYAGFGKVPVVFDTLVPGYVANRLQAALNLECLRMIEEGWATPETIDLSIQHGLVHRLAVLGHMRKMDFTGLVMVRNGIAGRSYQPPENTGETPVLDRLIAAGRSGVRAGAGFFDYGDAPVETLFHERDLKLLRLKALFADLKEEDR
ncbi:3-hydroxyacyl-CoA dehydrogenase family protein [Shimia sp. FJ5]|uniref:3-hydroxyacyl-CoA dehydrogenase family protein n=1 Tax=Shimia sp. FJ5 TaxID=3079054 RepID=UPI00261FF9B2|nr:3-hydroxyacyl-CoA dehydrogenase family protein [Shimia sp. FJ5]MDV4145283.1 3-hydroxyacyl-CoA dehydrogenase family protein [Shimia sp. FJ5]